MDTKVLEPGKLQVRLIVAYTHLSHFAHVCLVVLHLLAATTCPDACGDSVCLYCRVPCIQ
jgi:hypothetical protein